MTPEEVQAFCTNNGISVSAVGQPLKVVDPESLPPSVREWVNDDGTYKGAKADEADEAAETVEVDESDEAEEVAAPKKGKLPDDFPHVVALRDAGITTYKKAQDLGGDYSSVPGIGPAKGAEIDAALGESE